MLESSYPSSALLLLLGNPEFLKSTLDLVHAILLALELLSEESVNPVVIGLRR